MKAKHLLLQLKPDKASSSFYYFTLLTSLSISALFAAFFHHVGEDGVIGIYVQLMVPIAGFPMFMVFCSAIWPQKKTARIIVMTLFTIVYVALYAFEILVGTALASKDAGNGSKTFVFIVTTLIGGGMIRLIYGILINYNRYLKLSEAKRSKLITQVAEYVSFRYPVNVEEEDVTVYFRLTRRARGKAYEHYTEFSRYETPRREHRSFPFPLTSLGVEYGKITFPKNAYDFCCVDICQESDGFTFSVFMDGGTLTDNYEASLTHHRVAEPLRAEILEYLESKYYDKGAKFSILRIASFNLATTVQPFKLYRLNEKRSQAYDDLSGDVAAWTLADIGEYGYDGVVVKTNGEYSDDYDFNSYD